MEELIKRIIKKYDALIEELESIDKENRNQVAEANKNPDAPEVREWARMARENQRRLLMARAERDSLKIQYMDKEM